MRSKKLAMAAIAVAASLFLSFACHSAPSPVATASGRSMAVRVTGVRGVENFARVDERLYRGAQPTAEGYRNLKAMGVKTVISFRTNRDSRADAEAAGLTYLRLPVQADIFGSEPPTDDQVRAFFDAVLDAGKQPVYMHCMGGKDRTGTLCAVYRMEIEGWTNAEAIEEMQAFGFHDNYADLMNYVKSYKTRGYTIRR